MKLQRRWLLAAVLIALGSAVTVFMQSETVLVWLFAKAVKFMPGEVTVQVVRGRLAGPVELEGLRYRHETTLIYMDKLHLDWRPASLLAGTVDINLLEVDQLEIDLAKTTQSATTQSASTLPLDIALPVNIKLANTHLRNIRIRRDVQQAAMLIPRIDIEARAGPERLELVSLKFDLGSARLGIAGQLGLQSPYPLDLVTSWYWQAPGIPILTGHGRLTGDLRRLKLSQSLQTPSTAQLDAVIHQPLDKINWQAQLQVNTAQLSQWITTTTDLQLAARLQAQGDVAQFSWQGHFNAAGPVVGKLESEISGKYAAQVLTIEKMILQRKKSRTRFTLHGDIDLHDQPIMAIQAKWQNLFWPLAGQPQLSSSSGSCSVQGSLDRYRIKLETDLQGPAIPAGHWQLAGSGHQHGLQLDTLTGQVLDGQVSGELGIEWTPQLHWQLALNGKQLDAATFWPVQHGRLAFTLHSQGQIKDGVVQTVSRIDRLSGTLHQQPVSGAMQLAITGNSYQLSRFELSIGESRINVKGRVADYWDLQWRVHSPDLTIFSPYAGGQFDSEGQLSGLRAMPRIQAGLHGSKLVVGTFNAREVEAEIDLDMTGKRQSRLTSHASELRYAGQLLQSLQIKAGTLGQKLSLDIRVQGKALALNLHASGPFQAGRWQGVLNRADFETARLARWQLDAPSAFVVAKHNLRLDNACWSAAEAGFCFGAEQAASGNWRVTLTGKQFPLAVAEWFTPASLQFTGRVDGKAVIVISQQQLTGQANWVFSPGTIIYAPATATTVSLNYRGGVLQLRQDSEVLTGEIELDMEQANHLRLAVSLPRLAIPGLVIAPTQPVTARLQARLDQLAMLSLIFPELQAVSGRFSADISLEGTTTQPRLQGYARLEDGSVALPDLGITLQGLMLTATARAISQVQLTGHVRSGVGELQLDGQWQLDPAAGWPLQLSLHGKHFEALRNAEAWVLISPDLKLRMAGQRIDVEGSLDIPRAKLEPVGLPEGVSVSRDAVVTGNGIAEDASHYKAWEIYSKVRITLGNDVQFNGFGLRGRLTGEVLAEDTPQTLTTGSGELVIHHGRYRVYGENLEVDPGRLVFAGGPIDDPGLDARALRRLDEVIAGVQVRGTLNAPRLTLFSEPVMRESDILAYIVLGRPLDQSTRSEAALLVGVSSLLNFTGSRGLNDQIASRFGLEEISLRPGATPEEGVSLVLGKYLSPRLYISYLVGLSDSVTTVRARYKLGKKVTLQGESSTTQSGADILYTIER